jgi:hypothetical protein
MWGAAPPPGKRHRYIFSVQALSVMKLDVPDDSSGALVGFMAGIHALGKATLTVTYGAELSDSKPSLPKLNQNLVCAVMTGLCPIRRDKASSQCGRRVTKYGGESPNY